MKKILIISLALCMTGMTAIAAKKKKSDVQTFVHPGITYTIEDLNLMKDKVAEKAEPWYTAYQNVMKGRTKPEVKTTPYTHVISGPYNNPAIGSNDLSHAANIIYEYSLLWYLTNDEYYAKSAVDVLRQWGRLGIWSFDENNTKLIAALDGWKICNGAELLRYTYPGWTEADTEMTTRFLMSSLYPVLRFYNPEANGNWDGGIAATVAAIAIFTDNRQMFDNAVNHYKYSYANGSIAKYVYPDGQCQESTRDQGHVQMGLQLFTFAARIFLSQGVDVFELADARLALGYEYESSYLMGEEPHCYGFISPKRRDDINADYLVGYNAFTELGYDMPYTERFINERVLPKHNGLNVLTSYIAKLYNNPVAGKKKLVPSTIAYHVGATTEKQDGDASAIRVKPGQSIQDAIDRGAREGKAVLLLSGQHVIKNTLRLPSGTHLMGQGEETVLTCGSCNGFSVITAAQRQDVHDITLENFIMDAAHAYGIEPQNTERFRRTGKYANQQTGIMLCAFEEDGYRNITLRNLTVNNFSRNGIIMSGVRGFTIENCDVSDNGGHVVPGPRLQHNLKLLHMADGKVVNSRFDTSIKGVGVYADHLANVVFDRCEIARNAWYGMVLTESHDITITGCLIEGSDRSGLCLSWEYSGNKNVSITGNLFQLNNGHAIESYATQGLNIGSNDYRDNRLTPEKITDDKWLILEDLSEEQRQYIAI